MKRVTHSLGDCYNRQSFQLAMPRESNRRTELTGMKRMSPEGEKVPWTSTSTLVADDV
jgi:hypothetical protein